MLLYCVTLSLPNIHVTIIAMNNNINNSIIIIINNNNNDNRKQKRHNFTVNMELLFVPVSQVVSCGDGVSMLNHTLCKSLRKITNGHYNNQADCPF